MKPIRRALLIIFGLLLVGTGLFPVLAPVHPIGRAGYYLHYHFDPLFLYALGGAVAIIGLIPLLGGLLPPRKQPETVLRVGELGEVRISLEALENMVLRVVQQNRGIRGSSRRVHATPHGLVVHLRIKAAADQNLPELTGALQAGIKEYLEEATGIVVSEVRISVENIVLDQVPLKVK